MFLFTAYIFLFDRCICQSYCLFPVMHFSTESNGMVRKKKKQIGKYFLTFRYTPCEINQLFLQLQFFYVAPYTTFVQ